MNSGCGFNQAQFFGILSTGDTWYFVEFNPSKRPVFSSSEAFSIRLGQHESLVQLVNVFYAFALNTYIESVDAWSLRM